MAEHKRHQGHRQRMRERVQNYGLDSLAEHEALEYVLYLTNAQKDTNGIAHDLIDRFGDFASSAGILGAAWATSCGCLSTEGSGRCSRSGPFVDSWGISAWGCRTSLCSYASFAPITFWHVSL